MRSLSLVLALCVWPFAGALAQPESDEAEIRDVVEVRWKQGFDAGDSHALAALFTEDADFVTANGYWWRGRQEIEQGLGVVLTGPFRGSALEQHVEKIRFLTPNLALVHVWMQIRLPDGRVRRDRGDRIFAKQGGAWRCLALQNSVIKVPPEEIQGRLPGTQERVTP